MEVPASMWGCRTHWFKLPEKIRMNIWRHYNKGQEITKRPSMEYIVAANAAQDWIAQQPQEEKAQWLDK